MKKWVPLLVVLVMFIAAGGKLLVAKHYGSLCLSQDYVSLVSAPVYFCDSIVTVQPALF
jgi:hypothetical protein